ncbi:SDR family NAD(P)-dependent oxidoreductase [Streptomyces sp. NPDC059477]|uniref:SDR family NAD(P)-dependent oxidoreductase n=1 Tax=Streptomyces sp. NPDC059477 TaxID=3346847 RepID=UPI0036A8CC60
MTGTADAASTPGTPGVPLTPGTPGTPGTPLTPGAAGVALVTGAAGLIGRDVATRLAQDGYAVAVNCPPGPGHETAAAAVVADITARGGRAVVVPGDVSDPEQTTAMAARTRAELGPVTSLVCNAAVSVAARRDWRAHSAADWAEVLAVNVTGAYLCARAVHPDLVASGRGSVVVMASVTPLLGRTGNLPYVTSKAALIGLTRALAREVGPEGVRVNALAPGAIRGEAEAVYGDPGELERTMAALQSLPRRGEASDVASATAWLLGPGSGFVTGQLLVVDGGWVMH